MDAITNFETACHIVVKDPKANPYAKAYAQAGIGMQGHEARVQALYILSNISGWRGDKAKQVREYLKNFSKERD